MKVAAVWRCRTETKGAQAGLVTKVRRETSERRDLKALQDLEATRERLERSGGREKMVSLGETAPTVKPDLLEGLEYRVLLVVTESPEGLEQMDATVNVATKDPMVNPRLTVLKVTKE